MSKKKKRNKNKKLKINPQTLPEGELIQKVKQLYIQEKFGDAFTFVKVLFNRFDSTENRKLFKKVFFKKIQLLTLGNQQVDIKAIINEAKKKYPFSLISEAEEYYNIKRLNDSERLKYFVEKGEVLEEYRFQIADYLFFSLEKEKGFINKFPEYKDLFFVKEAFKNGFDSLNTPKMMVGISSKSPFKYWILLRKALTAFLTNDLSLLRTLSEKIPKNTFPYFLTSKLLLFQQFSQNQYEFRKMISEEDKAIFKVFLGDQLSNWMTFKRLSSEFKQNNIQTATSIFKTSAHSKGINRFEDFFYLFISHATEKYPNTHQMKVLIKSVMNFPPIANYYLNTPHLLFKMLNTKNSIGNEPVIFLNDALQQLNKAKSSVFKKEEIHAEILFYQAEHHQEDEDYDFEDLLFGSAGMDDEELLYIKAEKLEKSLKKSTHNPNIFKSLIAAYRELKEKKSKINTLAQHFISSFPDSSEAYQLSGDIALENKALIKAIDFYSKTSELTPLNTDLIKKIYDCFTQVIFNRTKKNAHLIENDLKKAEKFNLGNGKFKVHFELLHVKAIAHKFDLNIAIDKDELSKCIMAFEQLKQAPDLLFQALFHFEQMKKNTFFKDHLSEYQKVLIEKTDDKIFNSIFRFFIEYKAPLWQPKSFFYDIFITFLKWIKSHPMPNEESMLALVHQCAHHGWYKMLSALVISLNQRNPDHGVFGFLTCFFNPNFTIDKIKSYFSEKSVFEWLNTQSAQVIIKYILEDSRHYYYRLNDLLNDMIHTAHEIKPDNENTQKAVLADIKGQINRKTKSTLNQISKKILVHANHLDKTPIENIYALIDVKGVSNIPPKKKKPIPDKKRIKVPAKKIIVKTPKQKADQPGKQMNFFDMIDN
jgi:hypothetical protein